MIKPTIGRQLWFWRQDPALGNEQPQAATVAFVHNDRCVNVQIINHAGVAYPLSSVKLLQDDDVPPARGVGFCTWMPYQKGQAAKTEALEAQVRQVQSASLSMGDQLAECDVTQE